MIEEEETERKKTTAQSRQAQGKEEVMSFEFRGDQSVPYNVRMATKIEDRRGTALAVTAIALAGAAVAIGFLVYLLMRGPAALPSPEAALARCVNAATVATRGTCSHATIVDGCARGLIPGVDYKE